jgi:hypothetical protein
MDPAKQPVSPSLAEEKELATQHVSSAQDAEPASREKAKLSARSMVRLYVVMTVGYLVSTMQGYGEICALPGLSSYRHTNLL